MNTLSPNANGPVTALNSVASASSPASSVGAPPLALPGGATSSEQSAPAFCSSLRTSDPGLRTSPTPSSLFHPDLVEPWPDPVDGGLLLDELAGLLSRFVVLPSHAAEALALWTLHTYAFELRDVTTYLGLVSPEKRCGKTTLLGVLSELVHRPVVAANISPSAFFRVIEEIRPTLLIDEADTFLQGNDELRGILNSGYHRKTAFVVRVGTEQPTSPIPARRRAADEGGPPPSASSFPRFPISPHPSARLLRFSSWCPKVMAAIGRLPDTLADRCIVIKMQRKTHREQCERASNLDSLTLRRCCVRFIHDHASLIARSRAEVPSTLNDRAADIWEPLLVLADLAGGPWPAKARDAAVALSARAEESTPIGALLFDIFVALELTPDRRLFSRDLVDHLNNYLDRPWAEARNGRPITDLWLSQQLRRYGIRPRTVRIDGETARGYRFEQFEEVFRRYMPKSEIEYYKGLVVEEEGERASNQ